MRPYWVLVDAHAVALGAPMPAQPAAALAIGLLAALTADPYAAMNSHSSLVAREDLACGTDDCPSEPSWDCCVLTGVTGLCRPAASTPSRRSSSRPPGS